MKFDDSHEFLQALEEWLKKQAERKGRMQDYMSLREELAIERFLARIDPAVAIVKGGAATMFTVINTPQTRDVDLIIAADVVRASRLYNMDPKARADVLADLVQDQLRASVQRDFFRFKLEDAFPITDLKPEHACTRINITAMVGKTEIHFLQVDISLQDGEVPSNLVDARDMLKFAGVDNPRVRIVTPEYLVADKVTLYLEEHGTPGADRVKDIVHAALVIEQCTLDREQLAVLIADRAVHREVVEKLNDEIPDPPEHWDDRFQELVEQAEAQMTMMDAMHLIRASLDSVRNQALQLIKENTK